MLVRNAKLIDKSVMIKSENIEELNGIIDATNDTITKIGSVLVNKGLITNDALEDSLHIQNIFTRSNIHVPIGAVLIEEKHIEITQIASIVSELKIRPMALEALLTIKEDISQEEIEYAIGLLHKGKLLDRLLDEGIISQEELNDSLILQASHISECLKLDMHIGV